MNMHIEVFSVLGFGLSIVALVYTFILVRRKKKTKAGILLLLAIIIACISLPLRLLEVDIPNAIPKGYYHITCDFELDDVSEKIKTTADLYSYFNTEKQKFRIIEINGVGSFDVFGTYHFRGNEKLVVSVKKNSSGTKKSATLTIPEVNTKTLNISFIDSWYALSDGLNTFYICWAVLDALLILFYIILQVRSVSTYNDPEVSSVNTVKESANTGASITVDNYKKQIVCKKCGAIISMKDNYCKHCGTRIDPVLDEMSKEELLEYIQKLRDNTEDRTNEENNRKEPVMSDQTIVDITPSESIKE